jgi:hypothetical protein
MKTHPKLLRDLAAALGVTDLKDVARIELVIEGNKVPVTKKLFITDSKLGSVADRVDTVREVWDLAPRKAVFTS